MDHLESFPAKSLPLGDGWEEAGLPRGRKGSGLVIPSSLLQEGSPWLMDPGRREAF